LSKLSKILEEAIYCDLARDLTCSLSSHAIADDEYAMVQVVAEVVFVTDTNAANISFGSNVNGE
jgi:hypothetical protein